MRDVARFWQQPVMYMPRHKQLYNGTNKISLYVSAMQELFSVVLLSIPVLYHT